MSEANGKSFLSKNNLAMIISILSLVLMFAGIGVMWGDVKSDIAKNALAIEQIRAQSEKDKEEWREEVRIVAKQATANEVQFAEIQKDLLQIRVDQQAHLVITLDIRDRIYSGK